MFNDTCQFEHGRLEPRANSVLRIVDEIISRGSG